jgi:hypothetical protein
MFRLLARANSAKAAFNSRFSARKEKSCLSSALWGTTVSSTKGGTRGKGVGGGGSGQVANFGIAVFVPTFTSVE